MGLQCGCGKCLCSALVVLLTVVMATVPIVPHKLMNRLCQIRFWCLKDLMLPNLYNSARLFLKLVFDVFHDNKIQPFLFGQVCFLELCKY